MDVGIWPRLHATVVLVQTGPGRQESRVRGREREREGVCVCVCVSPESISWADGRISGQATGWLKAGQVGIAGDLQAEEAWRPMVVMVDLSLKPQPPARPSVRAHNKAASFCWMLLLSMSHALPTPPPRMHAVATQSSLSPAPIPRSPLLCTLCTLCTDSSDLSAGFLLPICCPESRISAALSVHSSQPGRG